MTSVSAGGGPGPAGCAEGDPAGDGQAEGDTAGGDATDVDGARLRRWAELAIVALERRRGEIDRINVFPVADQDTGTNLLLTMRGAVEQLRRHLPAQNGAGSPDQVAGALAHGALLHARGNSGVILSQLLRGLAETFAARPRGSACWAAGLRRAHELASAALSAPREGTVLSVLAAAAAAASERPRAPLRAAAEAAHAALGRTPEQLPDLARAGVVDAGGLGLTVLLDALVEAVTGQAPPPPRPAALAPGAGVAACGREMPAPGPGSHDHEVMYLLEAADPAAVDSLRDTLERLGDCVAVVSDGSGTWNVHVHCTDVGAAIEAGIDAGRPRRITVVHLADLPAVRAGGRANLQRAVLAVLAGAGMAQLARDSGAQVLERGRREVDAAELVAAVVRTGAAHVVLLVDDRTLAGAAAAAAERARELGRDVVVVPASSLPQCLAALAVHDPGRNPADDAVAMAEAAAGTRTGALAVADSEALTWVGRCAPGEVLGFSDGEVVLIAPDLPVGALWLAHRMLAPGGEMVTALLGAGVPDELGERLVEDLRRSHPEVDVVVHRGEQEDYPLVLGVE